MEGEVELARRKLILLKMRMDESRAKWQASTSSVSKFNEKNSLEILRMGGRDAEEWMMAGSREYVCVYI